MKSTAKTTSAQSPLLAIVNGAALKVVESDTPAITKPVAKTSGKPVVKSKLSESATEKALATAKTLNAAKMPATVAKIEFTAEMLDPKSQGYKLMHNISKMREELNKFFNNNKEHLLTKDGRTDIEKAFRWAFEVPSHATKPQGGWKKIKMYVQFTNALTYWRNCHNAECATADRIGGSPSGTAATFDTVEKVEKAIVRIKAKNEAAFKDAMINFIVNTYQEAELLAAFRHKQTLLAAADATLTAEAIAPRDTSAKAQAKAKQSSKKVA